MPFRVPNHVSHHVRHVRAHSHHVPHVRAQVREREGLHAQCLSTASLLASDRLACQGAMPLLLHSIYFGVHLRGAEVEAQSAALALLLRLTEAHGSVVLEPLQVLAAGCFGCPSLLAESRSSLPPWQHSHAPRQLHYGWTRAGCNPAHSSL